MKLSIEQKEKIRTALQALLRSPNADNFAIITEQTTNKFIQFAVNQNNLLFDFPSNQLNHDQLTRAKQILLPYEIFLDAEKAHDPNDQTKVTGEFSTFSKYIANDLNLAIELIEIILTQVFDVIGAIEFNIEEN